MNLSVDIFNQASMFFGKVIAKDILFYFSLWFYG